jgi:hypothetical protein
MDENHRGGVTVLIANLISRALSEKPPGGDSQLVEFLAQPRKVFCREQPMPGAFPYYREENDQLLAFDPSEETNEYRKTRWYLWPTFFRATDGR